MLPRITPELTIEKKYQAYLSALKITTFSGDIRTDYAARLAVATDNSVYQVIPQAVIHPKTTHDISLALELCLQTEFQEITFAPRGGGTGTNGQSLSSGIIIDCSKYMCRILEVNLDEKWVRVQPGVVLDQLNAYLQSLGMHFAPEISPSNRATIGGMINTDACGNGSKVIGRTSDHVRDLTCVLSDGRVIHTSEINDKNILIKKLHHLIEPEQYRIQEKFIQRPRNLNGYNLLNAYSGEINLNYLLCGSEGTLGIISECKLKINPIPKHKKLIVIKYKNFDDALRDRELQCILPNFEKGGLNGVLVIEAIDEKLLELARDDGIYFQIKPMLDSDVKPGAIALVELSSNNEEMISQAVNALCNQLDNPDSSQVSHDRKIIGYYIAKNATEIKLLWDLRKKSVGLISKKLIGSRRPIPFVEDTAVPPENLADYIAEFRALLDQHHLVYGMYGHVDAGCVHVRPALDLQQAEDEKLFNELSDQIAKLVQKYNGVMWGEHGMGYRSHYAEEFFGSELYHLVRQIKTVFDPYGRLNPGKIAIPLASLKDEAIKTIVSLNEPLRAKYDKQIPVQVQNDFPSAMACNGNGACFNYVTQEAMCPSFKVTKDRIHSPKGRATLMREWLRLLANKSCSPLNFKNSDTSIFKTSSLFFRKIANTFVKNDFNHEVYAAMNGCLSCKACASQCPLSVDVPEFRAKFLAIYHQRYIRPLRDYLVASIETLAPIQSRFAKTINSITQTKLVKFIFNKLFKIVDLPILSQLNANASWQPLAGNKNKMTNFDSLTAEQKERSVILLQDAFTSFYESDLVSKIIDILEKWGFQVFVLPFFPNGKPLHVKGFLNKFSQTAKKNIAYLREIAAHQIPMIGLDPSITLTYRDEYKKESNDQPLGFHVQLIQEWLVSKVPLIKIEEKKHNKYFLLSHCTEKTACVAAEKQWQEIFSAFGLTLIPLTAGCCGMAGTYGHEIEHQQHSRDLFAMDWCRYLDANPDMVILATGYSCRSQAKRLKGARLRHPMEVLFA